MISDKKFEKIEAALGRETMFELEAMDVQTLKDRLVGAEHSIMEAARELEANPKFQELKEGLKALSAGLKEVKKRQNSIIAYALSLLEDKGQQ